MNSTNGASANDSRENLLAQLRQEWHAIEAGQGDIARERAAVMTRYQARGMTHQAIAGALGLTQGCVSYLLRYGRFLASTTQVADTVPRSSTTQVADTVTLQTFRLFWNLCRDKERTKLWPGQSRDDEYERSVFVEIAARIAAGEVPASVAKKRARPGSGGDVAAVHKAARKCYDRLQPVLRSLKGLMGCSRATFAPNIIAGYAKQLHRELREFFHIFDVSLGDEI